MSRASISTGNIRFDTNKDSTPNSQEHDSPDTTPKPKPTDKEGPMHIAIVGDFSGRGSRGEHDATSIGQRKAIEVDRDNFEEVFAQLKVTLDLPFNESPIQFREFDDLHPDFLYNKTDLFDQFRQLKFKLNKPELFEEAAREITQWSDKESNKPDPSGESRPAEPEGIPLPESMLDAVLSQSQQAITAQKSDANNIDELIKSVVAPYVEAKEDPRLPELLEAVDNATAHTLRKIMHASAFQELEANWLALYLLIRRIETDRNLKLFIYDISREELIDDVINCEEVEDSQLYQLLVEQFQIPGAINYSVLQFNVQIQDDIDDICLANAIAAIAENLGGISVASVSPCLAGCENIEKGEDLSDWQYAIDPSIQSAWQVFRAVPTAKHLALAAPNFLLRLPYGKKTSPIESFHFEELAIDDAHPYYCWGNSATLVTLLLAESYSRAGWQFNAGQLNEVADLPLHVYTEDGESTTKACAEIYMRDSVAEKFAEAGILSVRSVKNSTSVMIPKFRTIAIDGTDIFQTH